MGVRKYKVTLGHTETEVEASDRQDALRKGRLAIAAEYPRLYDLVMEKSDDAFQIHAIK